MATDRPPPTTTENDTCISSVEDRWIWENERMVKRPINFAPELYRIFDTILVYAADNKRRDPKMDSVKVKIDAVENMISVWNNGDGIPVIEEPQTEGVYMPEFVFSDLLKSPCWTEFTIHTADGKRKKICKQVFTNIIGKQSELITMCGRRDNWTMVSFKPDLTYFGMKFIGSDDTLALMERRVVDIAGLLGESVKVELNECLVPSKTFKDYCRLYLQRSTTDTLLYEKVNDRWEVCIGRANSRFEQVSFVNYIATMKGGSHVVYLTNQISRYLVRKACSTKKRLSGTTRYPWLFVNAFIDNPAFDSQTNKLTTNEGRFGSTCILKRPFLRKVAMSGLVKSCIKTKTIRPISKLLDAALAGSAYSQNCTLMITEGDSAKAFAMRGLNIVGWDRYGVLAVKGKVLNVRDATSERVLGSAEIQNIKETLGLVEDKIYDSVEELRYGHLMLLMDQDFDGSHIKGLLINFIHKFWPSLLKVPNFMLEFITPVLKATHKKNNEVLPFYSMPEYKIWNEQLGEKASEYEIKYYKGLGTSLTEEAELYFKDLDLHVKEFVWKDHEDDEAIKRAFSKDEIDSRKLWLKKKEDCMCIDSMKKQIRYRDFFNIEFKQYCLAAIERCIPSIVDGLKPGQRKIVFSAFKKSIVEEMKVSTFGGFVILEAAYQHGELCLESTIIRMAQDYAGSNNINLLQPKGQFGSREMGGKDAAQGKYISTHLSPITQYLFHKIDEAFLEYLNDEGHSVEPTWFLPIVPLILVNGAEGIAPGRSTFIPNYNPRDIIANLRHLLNDEEMVDMHPWYKGFGGTIRLRASTGTEDTAAYATTGVIEWEEQNLIISELPLFMSRESYIKKLDKALHKNTILGYHSRSDGKFCVALSQKMLNASPTKLIEKLKLTTTFTTSNMYLFDTKGVVKKYTNPKQILQEFFEFRLGFYEKRKTALLLKLKEDLLPLESKLEFIRAVLSNQICCHDRDPVELCEELTSKGFHGIPGTEDAEFGKFDYLMSIPSKSMSSVMMVRLEKELAAKKKEIVDLSQNSPKSLWLRDLDALDHLLHLEEERYKSKREFDSLTQKLSLNQWLDSDVILEMEEEQEEKKKKFDALDNQLKEEYGKVEMERRKQHEKPRDTGGGSERDVS